MKKGTILFCLLVSSLVRAQTISSFVPGIVNPGDRFLFYLHGGIIQEQGVNAVSQYYGPYEYLAILDSLSRRGFTVISEPRARGTDEEEYGKKVAMQVDTLLHRGVAADNIVIVGASQGAYITVEAAYIIRNRDIRYVVMGLCTDYSVGYFSKYQKDLCGNFLSIYETSDEKGSCGRLFSDRSCKAGYKEMRLAMGNGHGFLYKPYSEWIEAIMTWVDEEVK